MTAEEKAKYLIDKFGAIFGSPIKYQESQGISADERIKNRALLCCDEVLAEHADIEENYDISLRLDTEYWLSVKDAIRRL